MGEENQAYGETPLPRRGKILHSSSATIRERTRAHTTDEPHNQRGRNPKASWLS